jgi:hypothetical protein
LTHDPKMNIVIATNRNIDFAEAYYFVKNQYLFSENNQKYEEGNIWLPTFRITSKDQIFS